VFTFDKLLVTAVSLCPAASYEYLKQLQRDALWSDPTDEAGCYLNPRGAGVTFGPDVAKQFMALNDLFMVVRSHECCFRGFELPYSMPYKDMSSTMSFYNKGAALPVEEDYPVRDEPLVCTLFSASNYIGGDNEGAFLQLMRHPFTNSFPVFRSSVNKRSASFRSSHPHLLHYGVRRYKTTEPEQDIEDSNKTSLTGVSGLVMCIVSVFS
jgi:hypothetical protein